MSKVVSLPYKECLIVEMLAEILKFWAFNFDFQTVVWRCEGFTVALYQVLRDNDCFEQFIQEKQQN